jgi:hypothetical protein
MLRLAQLECPGFCGGEHGVVEPHREQHDPTAVVALQPEML